MGLFLSECADFLGSKNNFKFTKFIKTCFLKRGGVHMCKYKYIYYVARLFFMGQAHDVVVQSYKNYNTLKVEIVEIQRHAKIISSALLKNFNFSRTL